MRTLPPTLAAKLQGGVTTLCWCWKITRKDATTLGFTDHDRDLAFDGVTYRRASVRASGTLETEASFAGGTTAVAGVLDDETISAGDIANGLYQGARVQLFRVDWGDPADRVLVWAGFLGEISRGELGFEAELRGRQASLERGVGRVYQRRCDAELGDARCTVDLELPAHRGEGVVSTVIDSRSFRTSDLGAFADGWFTRGALTWISGANAGAAAEVEAHRGGGSVTTLELLVPSSAPLAPGDGFVVRAGCDKRWMSCKTKFANTVNFRGFPMMPGDDWLQAGPRIGDVNAGGSLWTDRSA
jgi:uncharacterized phage protein (TIGR02218 family)